MIPGDVNLVTDDGCRYWSPGAIHCKDNIHWASDVFKNYEGNEHGAVDGLVAEFCDDYQNVFEDFPCFQWRFAFFALLSSMLNKALVRLLLHSWLAVLPIKKKPPSMRSKTAALPPGLSTDQLAIEQFAGHGAVALQ